MVQLQRLDECQVKLKHKDATSAAVNSNLHKATQELHAIHQHQMSQISCQLKQKDSIIREFHNFTKVWTIADILLGYTVICMF